MTSRTPRVLTAAAILLPIVAAPAHAQSLPLVTALDSAFATHPTLDRAEALEESASQAASSARAARWPTLSLRSGLTRFEEPMLANPIHAFDPSLFPEFDRTLVQSQLFAGYTLLDWGARSGSIGAADAQQHAAAAAIRGARAEVIEHVAEAYFRLVAARAVDAAAAARIVALEEERDRAERALAAGTAAEVERLRAAVALQDAEAQRTTTAGAVTLAERTLARVIGTTPERVVAAELDTVDPSGPVEAGGPGRGSHPTIEQASGRVEAARSRAALARGPRWPRIDMSAGVNQFGTLDLAPIFEWQAGLSLSWEIFSGGSRTAAVRRADADVRAAESELAAVELEIATAVDAARTAIEAADARVAALDASVGQWEELVRIESLALEAGAGTQRDLLDAEAGLFQARAGRIEAASEAFLARVRLAAAEGRLDRSWILRMSGGA